MQPLFPTASPFRSKLAECLFVSIAVVNTYYMQVCYPLDFVFEDVPAIRVFNQFSFPAVLLAGILFAIICPVYWRKKERSGTINSPRLHAWLRGIIRYWLALQITTYGIAKIWKHQFGQSYLREDSLVSTLSGFDLTWNYFGYSYALTVIIGLLQIGGSILLLYRRSWLLGVAILLPVMINITLIDIFYQIPVAATLNAVLFTLGLLYLLLLRWKELVALFLPSTDQLPPVRFGVIKPVLKWGGLLFVLAFAYYADQAKSAYPLAGKWRVEEQIRNGQPVDADAWLHDPGAWQYVYMEAYGSITFSSNPFVLEQDKARRGHYEYDSSKHTVNLRMFGDDLSSTARVSSQDAGHMLWTIIDNKDTTVLRLSKVEKGAHL